MVINHKKKFIFISSGRTGSTSAEKILSATNEEDCLNHSVPGLYTKGHIPAALIRAHLGASIWEEYYSVVFVRNPFDWIVSQFAYNLRKAKPDALKRGETTMLAAKDILWIYDHLKRHRGRYKTGSLFQTNYACDLDGQLIVNHIAKYENYEDELKAIFSRAGVRGQIPHLNKSARHKHIISLSDEAQVVVKELYKIDFETFKYT